MNREQVVARMQKPARILRVFASIFFVFAIIGTAILIIFQLAMPVFAESMIALLDSPQVEQTEEVRQSIALFSEYAALPMYATVTMTIYMLLGGGTSIVMFYFLKKLFASLAEERYSILRTEYANSIQKIAIVMLVSTGLDMIFPVIIELMTKKADLLLESSTSDMLIPGLLLLAVAAIYRHACRLQLLNEQESFENFKANNSESSQSEEAKNYRFEEENKTEKEEKPPFEGF